MYFVLKIAVTDVVLSSIAKFFQGLERKGE